MSDIERRIIELERRQLASAMAQQQTYDLLAKASQETHQHWWNTYPADLSKGGGIPSTNYPWAMKRVWVTLDWDTSVVFDPYVGHKAPSTYYDAYAWPSGHRILCDWSNANPQVPYNGAQWFGTVGTETRYGYQSSPTSSEIAVQFSAIWNTSSQTFSLYLTNYYWSRPQRVLRYNWDQPSNSWKTGDSTSNAVSWNFGFDSVVTVPYDAANPQFIGNGSLSTTATMRLTFTKGQLTDYWSSGTKPDGTTCPFAPIFPATPDKRYALHAGDPDPDIWIPDINYLATTPCNVTVEWEN